MSLPVVLPQAKHAWFEFLYESLPKRSAHERVADFFEIYGPYDEAKAREQAARCLQCPEPMCVTGCPLANRIPEWLLLTAEGQFLEAAALSRSTSNLPEVCGRICPHDKLCEGACILNGHADAVAIGALEQFINEYAFAHGAVDACPVPANGLRVAVLGSGPAGISCADELAKRGYAVTVFESRPTLGGLLVNGIPAFKLEKSVVDRRVELLRKRGVEFRLGVAIGKDVSLTDLRAGFDATFLGFGAQQARPLDVPGAELLGVVNALPFLIQKNTDMPTEIPPLDVVGKRVVVLGGGDTAMDCLRTAIRCGASKAIAIYRRDLANMPGSRREYENAIEEGAVFVFQAAPLEVLGDASGRVKAVRCARIELGPPDQTGRRRPVLVPGSELVEEADAVVVAFGFDPVRFPDWSDFSQVKTNDWGGVEVDARQMTNLPGVFAGGDLVRGPSFVVHAVRDARRAAREIHRFLFARRAGELGAGQADHFSP